MTATTGSAPISGSLRTVTQPIRQYLDDPRVIEIMCNSDGRVWVERAGEGMSRTEVNMAPAEVEALLRFVATESRSTLTADTPALAGTLPHWNARVQGLIPPIVARPNFGMRKPATVIYSLDDYVTKGVVSPEQRDALVRAVTEGKNILVGGGTGTGKTTFLNALLRVVTERTNDRLYIAEDTPELQCASENKTVVETKRGKFEMRDAVFAALRLRPDRIIVGEIRDATALDLMMAWNTGHQGGLATIHANDSSGMLTRFCQLIEQDRKRADKALVAQAIHVCVHLTRDLRVAAGRRLTGLDSVQGYDRVARRWLLAPLA